MQAGPLVVVVDDEPELRRLVEEYLGRHGYRVHAAGCGAELDACLAKVQPDLLILDVNMPGETGFAIARRLRAASDVPILMLTAADEVADRVVGLELGADDYLTKPFDLRELRARIQTVLRRTTRPPAAPPAPPPAAALASKLAAPLAAFPAPTVPIGEFRLDLDARRLLRADGATLALTAMEFDLLAAFARHPNRVLSRDRLLDLAHPGDGGVFDRSIDVRVTRLRRKIERDPTQPRLIRTVRGAGYMFVPSPP